eukprot:2163700-Rhodomonas_salina.2
MLEQNRLGRVEEGRDQPPARPLYSGPPTRRPPLPTAGSGLLSSPGSASKGSRPCTSLGCGCWTGGQPPSRFRAACRPAALPCRPAPGTQRQSCCTRSTRSTLEGCCKRGANVLEVGDERVEGP